MLHGEGRRLLRGEAATAFVRAATRHRGAEAQITATTLLIPHAPTTGVGALIFRFALPSFLSFPLGYLSIAGVGVTQRTIVVIYASAWGGSCGSSYAYLLFRLSVLHTKLSG